MKHKNIKNKAFTLIELLVVIAIIGLLSTIAVAALNSSMVKARDARRLSDLKQMRTLIEVYINDNEKVPGSGQTCFHSDNSTEWSNLAIALGQTQLAVDPDNGNSDHKYAFFRSNYAAGGCGVNPECGWLMTKREEDNYLVIMPFFKGGYSINTVAASWNPGTWSPNCGGDSYSGYVEY